MEAETEQAADAAATIPGVDSVAVTLYRWTVVHGRLTPATLAQAAAETGIGEPDCRMGASGPHRGLSPPGRSRRRSRRRPR